MFRDCGGVTHALQTKWLRITQNPENHCYPKTGDFIGIIGHPILDNGKYLVTMVEEFEPPYNKDENGRDIRITLIEDKTGKRWSTMNAKNILKSIIKKKGEKII